MTLSNERQRLREAIEAQTHAQQAVDEAKRAAQHAQSKWSACSSAIGALTRELEEAEEEHADSSDRFIEQLAGGLDVCVQSRVDELRKALDAAEIESAVWSATIKTAEGAIEARMRAFELAQDRVAEQARRVASAEIDVTAMIARAEAARQATLRESATLMAVARMLPQASLGRQAIENFMQQPWCAPISIERAVGGESYRTWFAALCADADAKMN